MLSKGILILFVMNFTLQVSLVGKEGKVTASERATTVVLQNAQVTRAPIRIVSSAAVETREIDLFRFDFQEIYYGFEGPNYTRMKGEPSTGAELIAQAQLFRPEAVRTARFEFVDARGRELNTLFFTKESSDFLDGDFIGVVTVPSEPFRVRVSGSDVTGKPYQRVYPRLFRPIKGRSAALQLPRGIPSHQAPSIIRMIELHDQQTRTWLMEQGQKNANGTITLPRVEVSEATYEPLVSDRGNVIGLRIRYAVRVSHDGNYSFEPSVWPIYGEASLRSVEMQPIAVAADPLPDGLNAKTGAITLRYGGGATYRAGKTYRFVVDTIPSFAIQNAQRTRFCIMRSTFKGSPALEATWRSITMSDRPVSYGTNINWTTFRGRTGSFSGLGVFYRSFVKEGARECSEGGNINF